MTIVEHLLLKEWMDEMLKEQKPTVPLSLNEVHVLGSIRDGEEYGNQIRA